jgi:hypothetical protein
LPDGRSWESAKLGAIWRALARFLAPDRRGRQGGSSNALG